MVKRLLFLDFDGVLHPNHCAEEAYFCRMPLLANLVESVGDDLGIVISSSWRHHHAYEELLAVLPDTVSQNVVGATGVPFVGKHARYQEILAFLTDFRGWSDWRALDDSAWEFPDGCPELIRCDGAVGLTEREIRRIADWTLRTQGGGSPC